MLDLMLRELADAGESVFILYQTAAYFKYNIEVLPAAGASVDPVDDVAHHVYPFAVQRFEL